MLNYVTNKYLNPYLAATNNSFEQFLLLVSESNNDTLYYSQIIKTHDIKDVKKAIAKQ